MQDSDKGSKRERRTTRSGDAGDAAAFAAEVAAMSPAEREARFPTHSDGQVCR